jgi:myo-inositol-1(or 4)-monophosphatase
MKDEDIRFWSRISYEIMEEVNKVISPLVGQKKAGKIVKMGADGTPTKLIDLAAEEKVIEILENTGRPLTVVSEEIGKLKLGDTPSEVVLVVDPLDGTNNAVKNIPAYAISIAIGKISNSKKSMTINDLELGFVKNFATGDVYHAVKGRGANLNGEVISTSNQDDLSSSLIGAYVYRADMEKVDRLCKMIRRMRILGSVAIELCYVAEGIYDAFVDVRGNQRVMDLAAGKIIVEEAGGLVTNEYNQPLLKKLNVLERTSIIASGNRNIHKELIQILGEGV